MQLAQVIEDVTLLVAGYEHCTWHCSGCGEVERRMVFTRQKAPAENVPLPPTHPERPTARLKAGAWMQTIAKLRSKQNEIKQRPNDREEAARTAERHAQFDRDWEKFVPSSSQLLKLPSTSRPRTG
jgi:hypothetical protein